MKLTKSRLKEIIKEEIKNLTEKNKYKFVKKFKDLKAAQKFASDSGEAVITKSKDGQWNVSVLEEGKLKEGGKEIAQTILQQLGGNKFIAMTGAKNLGFTNKGLQMKIGRNAKGVTHVIIELTSMDLYDIEFVKVRAMKRTTIKKLKGIYADQLGEIFKKYTGLNIRL